jgi:meso-butanediol dehydrogenase/(S,S)-butanediol dehydrogenase/diacetyl reductase
MTETTAPVPYAGNGYPQVDLAGRVAVITGASSGIGEALALALSARGVRLALISRSGGGPDLPDSVRLAADVADPEAVDAAVAAAVAQFGGLDIAVANAGVGSYGLFLDVPRRHDTEMVSTNVLGTINLYRSAVPHLVACGRGDLITVTSEAGRRAFPGEAVYCATKFAQVALTRALDNELREQGIRASNICPGGVWTNFAMDDGRGRTHGSPQTQDMMRAEDVAELIVFVLTRPRHMRILETALRPVSEQQWG